MQVPREYLEEERSFSEFDVVQEDDKESLSYKREVRRKLEDRLEKKRLRDEINEYDDDFEWDEK